MLAAACGLSCGGRFCFGGNVGEATWYGVAGSASIQRNTIASTDQCGAAQIGQQGGHKVKKMRTQGKEYVGDHSGAGEGCRICTSPAALVLVRTSSGGNDRLGFVFTAHGRTAISFLTDFTPSPLRVRPSAVFRSIAFLAKPAA